MFVSEDSGRASSSALSWIIVAFCAAAIVSARIQAEDPTHIPAQLGSQEGGPQLFSGFHMAMAVARSRAFSPRSRCSLSSRGPTSTSSRETDPFGVRNHQAGEAGRKQ
jgi:hypothetical protein